MRKNTQAVIDAFVARAMCHRADAIWTNGRDVYSYRTCIMTRDVTGRYIINRTKYSATTSAHQKGLAAAFPFALHVQGIPQGSDYLPLIAAAGPPGTSQEMIDDSGGRMDGRCSQARA